MPRNGTGTYALPALNPVVPATTITSAWGNNTMNDIATALTASIANNGVTPVLANLPMSGFKHTAVAIAAAYDQYARADQVQEAQFNLLSGVGSSGATNTAYTATLQLNQPTARPFTLNQVVTLIPNTDAIGAPTLSVNGAAAATILAPAGGSAANYLRANTPINLSWNGTTWVVLGSASATIPYNYIINGGMGVTQRAQQNLNAALRYGIVDRFKCAVPVGAVTAGIIQSTTAAPVGRTGNALYLNGVSASGTPNINIETYIEGADAVNLKNAFASFVAQVYHDAGAPINYTIQIDKPNILNGFSGAMTNIGTSAPIAVPTATATQIKYENITMGDCSNGIRVRITINGFASITNKNFYYTEMALTEGTVIIPFTRVPANVELTKCLRYFQKTFVYGVQPGQNGGQNGVYEYTVSRAGIATVDMMANLQAPMPSNATMTFYNPLANNANWYNATAAADSGPGSLVGQVGSSGACLRNVQVAGDSIGYRIQVHYTIDADF